MRHLLRKYGDIQFILPLRVGKRFGNAGEKLREDGCHQWVVESAAPVTISGKQFKEVYLLTNRSLDAALAVHVIAGTGVTRGTSTHLAGSLYDWDLELARCCLE